MIEMIESQNELGVFELETEFPSQPIEPGAGSVDPSDEGLLDSEAGGESAEDESATPTSAPEAREMRWQDRITQLASEIAQREGCELYDLEVVGGGGNRIVRVTIDRESGVSIDDCSNVSRGLNLILDVEDIIPGGAYQLEVSSPGIERGLRTPRHFQRAIGQRVQIKTFETLGALKALVALEQPTPAEAKALQHWGTQKSFEARLLAFDELTVHFEIKLPEPKAKDGVLRSLVAHVPLDKIAKAHTVFDMEKNFGSSTQGQPAQRPKPEHPKKKSGGKP